MRNGFLMGEAAHGMKLILRVARSARFFPAVLMGFPLHIYKESVKEARDHMDVRFL